MKKIEREMAVLIGVIIIATIIFVVLYQQNRIEIEPVGEQIAESSLSDWTEENSTINGAPLKEDKSIYGERDNSIYDVYINVFPTKDENGEVIDFSAFGKHVARDHSYNPTLNCNIQILNEGEELDPLVNLDVKNATIRVRGNSSRGDTYKSYKVKLNDEAGEFKGQTSLNINKHVEDYSKITSKFCTDVLQEIDDLSSYRTNFMRVWIRDASLPNAEYEYYGLFTHTEQPNKTYLETRGLSSNCVLYKARNFSFYKNPAIVNVDDPTYSEEEFEMLLGIREASDHDKLIEMLNVVNDETTDFQEVVDTYFNEDNVVSYLAFSILMGAEDILNHNYLLYSPNNAKTWYFIPWDFDSNLASDDDEYIPQSLQNGQKLNMSIFYRRFLRLPGSLEKIQNRMDELMDTCLSSENIHKITSGYTPVLEKTMMLEPDLGLLDMEPDMLLPYIESFPELIQSNYDNFVYAFQYPAPMYVDMPVKNNDGSLHLAWDSSYSYQGRTIVYNVQIADDCHMENILYEQKGIIENQIDVPEEFEAGTYYLKVTAEDSEGNEQLSLEHYEFAGAIFIYESGVLEFSIE